MPHDFVVLSTMRCGSYHLTSLLNSAPDLTCLGEIYKPGKVELPLPLLRQLGLKMRDTDARDGMGAGFLDQLARATPGSALGFKLFPPHVANGPPFLRPELFSGRRRIVALIRPALEIAVSLAAGRGNGALTQKGPSSATQQAVPVAERQIEAADTYHKRLTSMRNRLDEAPDVAVFDIAYADLNTPARLNALLTFIGSTATALDLQSEYQKQGRGALHERVTNWPDVLQILEETGKTHLLAPAGYQPDGALS